ncbi:MAG TPA: TetR family transcriptional regulator [Ensifer sp.]|uniref:TetR/AcrR family transcriptional regulator n=1 Tax=Ensifer sp. TaxID=1872086 RepID=UPI002E11688E|nr:TetR family transcriptional regulator [Ensifer sp.]
MPRISSDRAEERRRHILDAAMRAFIASGFSATSIRDICKEAGMSIGGVYVHFDGKDAIVEGLVAELLPDHAFPLTMASDLQGLEAALVEDAIASMRDWNAAEAAAWLEIVGASHRSPRIAAIFSARLARATEALAAVLMRVGGGAMGEGEARVHAQALLAALEGLMLVRLMEPASDAEGRAQAVRILVRGALLGIVANPTRAGA